MDEPSALAIVVGLATGALIFWMVFTSSLLRIAELLAALQPGRRRPQSLASLLRRIAPKQDSAGGKTEGTGGCLLVMVSLWLVVTGNLWMPYVLDGYDLTLALLLIPGLALLWLMGLGALSMRDGLSTKRDYVTTTLNDDVQRKARRAFRAGFLPDLGALLAVVMFIFALALAVLAGFTVMFLLVPPGDGGRFQAPDFEREDREKAPARKPPAPRPHR